MQPTDPDDRPTQPLGDDVWAPRPDTVDSAEPTAVADRPRGLRMLGIAGAALALVAAGAFGAFLVSSGGGDDATSLTGVGSGSTDDESGTDDGTEDGTAPERRGPMMRHGFGGMGLGGPLLGRGLHGSYVVENPDGGYQTVLSQQGTATSVSDTSITVKSEDGFVATYRLTEETAVLSGPSGTDAIAEGADVAVTALRSGSSPRALHVVDLSQLKERFHHFGDAPDGDVPQPSETATSGASV